MTQSNSEIGMQKNENVPTEGESSQEVSAGVQISEKDQGLRKKRKRKADRLSDRRSRDEQNSYE